MRTRIAPRLDPIKPSPSMAATAKAAELRAAGIDIISLTVGEPDFDTPQHIREAAFRAMERGDTRYTAVDGTKELKQAIAAKFARDNGIEYSASEITVAGGAKQVIYNALMATLAPGDEVVVPAPYWVSYTDMVLLAEGRPVVIPCGSETGFKLRPDQLARAITDRTRWLILNTPSNPTGAIYSKEELQALGEVLLRHPHVLILTDDIYEHIIFDGRVFHTLAQVVPTLKARVLTVNGVSKAYAMTGWRIGYAGGPQDLIQAMAMLQSQSTTNPCSISQAASVAALNGPQDSLATRSAEYQKRRDFALERILRIEGFTCEKPEGAFYLYPGCRGLLGKRTSGGHLLETDLDVTMYFLEEAKVALLQGGAYGVSPHLRLSIATSQENLSEALDRIEASVGRLS